MTELAQQLKQRTRTDIIVRRLVTVFGCSVLVMFLVIIWHLFAQTLPLFLSPELTQQQRIDSPVGGLTSSGDFLNGGTLVAGAENCSLQLFDQELTKSYYVQPCSHELGVIEDRDIRWLYDISELGQVRLKALDATDYTFSFAIPTEQWQGRVDTDIAIEMPFVSIRVTTDVAHKVFWFNTNDLTQVSVTEYGLENSLVMLPGLQSVAVYSAAKFTVVSRTKALAALHTADAGIQTIMSIDNSRSLFVFDADQMLSRWVVTNQGGLFKYKQTYAFSLAENETPLKIQSHANSNAGLVLTNFANLILFNRVTGEQFQTQQLAALPVSIAWYGERIYLVYDSHIDVWSLSNSAGLTTFSALFSPQWYEGYATPQHIYQTTSGSDFQEAKYALVPLFIGSFKAALVALFVALPISFGAAVYTGFFANPVLRKRVKPTIEMLEAIPSVVIGFIAAISLAPLAEELLVGVLFFLVTMPLLLFCLAMLQAKWDISLPKFMQAYSDLVLAAIALLMWGLLSMAVASSVFPQDIFAGMSKTTLIVAIALGVAISPTIYTLAEDAIDSVPSSIKSASFALGATRLQTLRNVVLRVAMPGLVAATMLGFGRAFGETMIVLMVTGNTPIPSWDIFESLRALTANIAIELPEADKGGTLYSVLFLTALMLFIFTFVVNTVAEWLRHTMREKVKYD